MSRRIQIGGQKGNALVVTRGWKRFRQSLPYINFLVMIAQL